MHNAAHLTCAPLIELSQFYCVRSGAPRFCFQIGRRYFSNRLASLEGRVGLKLGARVEAADLAGFDKVAGLGGKVVRVQCPKNGVESTAFTPLRGIVSGASSGV